jgi:hypothetical protein
MNLSRRDTDVIEAALDRLFLAIDIESPDATDARLLYQRAIAIVRDRPPGQRRIRKDYDRPRQPKGQRQLIEAPP